MVMRDELVDEEGKGVVRMSEIRKGKDDDEDVLDDEGKEDSEDE
jgi:hypothetical protein